MAFLGETLTTLPALGVVLVVVGLVVLTRSSDEADESVDPRTAVLVSLLIVVRVGTAPVVRESGLSEPGAPLVPALASNFADGLAVGVAVSLYRDTGQLRVVVSGKGRWYLLVGRAGRPPSARTSWRSRWPTPSSSPSSTPVSRSPSRSGFCYWGHESPTRATLAGAATTVREVVVVTVG